MIVYLNPVTGLSGDMLLGALLDLGAPLARIRDAVTATGLTGWRLSAQRVDVDGLVATQAVVEVDEHGLERRAADLLGYVRQAAPEPVASMAERAVSAIAGVEGALHDRDPDQVHLHELGGADTIVDTVAVAAALHAMNVTAVHCGPVALGNGQISTRHGILPAPAPATMALLTGADVYGIEVADETVTPTGAALLNAADARFGPMPPMRVVRTGYGAGAKRFPGRPNVLQIVAGEPRPVPPGDVAANETEELTLLETNLDDVTAEQLAYLMERALSSGAVDAWSSPVVMKKGRPAHVAHLLCHPADAQVLEDLLFRESGTLGIRRQHTTRTIVPRTFSHVAIHGHRIRVKHGPHASKPEHDDVVAAAQALDMPIRDLVSRVLAVVQSTAQCDPPARGGGRTNA